MGASSAAKFCSQPVLARLMKNGFGFGFNKISKTLAWASVSCLCDRFFNYCGELDVYWSR